MPFINSSSGNVIFNPNADSYSVWISFNCQIADPAVYLYYSLDDGLTYIGPNDCSGYELKYTGCIPVQQAGSNLDYYFEFFDDEGERYFLPENAPDQIYSLEVSFSGDANQDGTTNIFDLLSLLSQISQPNTATESADINKDGKVNIFDLLALLKALKAEG